MTPQDHERGSAVVEALVAALIVAATVGAGFASVREAASRARGLDARARAMLVAESQLATVGAVVPVATGTTHGVDGDYAWTIEVAPSDIVADGGLARVTVLVAPAAGGAALARLATLRPVT